MVGQRLRDLCECSDAAVRVCIRIAATSPTDSAVSKSVVAACPAGQRVVGAGHEIASGKGQVLLNDVVPTADLTSVRVEAIEDREGTANWSVTAYAVCADA